MAGIPPIAGGCLLFIFEIREKILKRKMNKNNIEDTEMQSLAKGIHQNQGKFILLNASNTL